MKDFVEKCFYARQNKKIKIMQNGERMFSTSYKIGFIPCNFNNAFQKQKESSKIRAQPE